MLCKPNSTAKPSRSVRIIANVLNACCTAANAFRNVNYLYNILLSCDFYPNYLTFCLSYFGVQTLRLSGRCMGVSVFYSNLFNSIEDSENLTALREVIDYGITSESIHYVIYEQV